MADSTIADPLGRFVTLHDRTWYGHIITGHPEVAEHRARLEAAIASPNEIRASRSDPNCRIYFAPGPRIGVRIMVVVDVVLGIVKMAHLAARLSGGPVEWSK